MGKLTPGIEELDPTERRRARVLVRRLARAVLSAADGEADAARARFLANLDADPSPAARAVAMWVNWAILREQVARAALRQEAAEGAARAEGGEHAG